MNTIQNLNKIQDKWAKVLDAVNDFKTNDARIATAVVLENTQNSINEKAGRGRSLIGEGVTSLGSMGPFNASNYDATATYGTDDGLNGDARVPNVVLPLLRRVFPKLLAHELVGVQAMQNSVGMAFAFRPVYGRNHTDDDRSKGKEIGYNFVDAGHTGHVPTADPNAWFNATDFVASGATVGVNGNIQPPAASGILSATENFWAATAMTGYDPTSKIETVQDLFGIPGVGAGIGESEYWGVGDDAHPMPEAGFEFLKAMVEAKSRKLGIRITREAEEDMKAMQGINAQAEINNMLSYEINAEIDRQLLAEIALAAANEGNVHDWSPANAMGTSSTERINSLYTAILGESAKIAVQNRRGAANWAVCSPLAAALLESQIYNPLSVAGGLGNANAFGKEIDANIGVTQIGTLRNGTIKLFRDTMAKGDYVMLGYKGAGVYDAGIIYLPYIPLEITTAIDYRSMNPVTAARTRYGITSNLFGAGKYYSLIKLNGIAGNGTSGFFQW